MKIRIEDTAYEGTGTEIMDQLRKAAFDPRSFRTQKAISGSFAAISSA